MSAVAGKTPTGKARPLRLEIYRAGAECLADHEKQEACILSWQWRWTLRAGNGVIIDASTEAYTRRAGVDANLLQAHGLDVAGIKPGETVLFYRTITTTRQTVAGLWGGMRETSTHIRVSVTP